MMHDRAAERADHSGWHYISGNSRVGGYPIGYCAEHGPHATEAEAQECYGQWRRDHVTLDRKSSNWNSCQIEGCKNPAQNIAGIEGDGYSMAVLCDDHFDKEHAIQAMSLEGAAGESWHS